MWQSHLSALGTLLCTRASCEDSAQRMIYYCIMYICCIWNIYSLLTKHISFFCGIQTNVTPPLDADIYPFHGHIGSLIFCSRPFGHMCQPYVAGCHEAGHVWHGRLHGSWQVEGLSFWWLRIWKRGVKLSRPEDTSREDWERGLSALCVRRISPPATLTDT